MKNIAIVSVESDFHALLIYHALKQYPDINCHLIEMDKLCARASLGWSLASDTSFILDNKGIRVSIDTLDVIWWRRTKSFQQIPPEVTEHAHQELINVSFYSSLLGVLYTKFSGKWISHPVATNLASNKLFQLQAAKKSGFRVPQTIVSQDPDEIRKFYSSVGSETVVKALHPSNQGLLYTQVIKKDHLLSDKSIMLCPAIYQELIPGKIHLRVNVFGKDAYAVMLETSDLDWRLDLSGVKMTISSLEDKTKERIYRVCEELKLEMGIFDLKVTPDGEIIWLEVNPQGQFLFLEGITGLPLTTLFAKFLHDQVFAE